MAKIKIPAVMSDTGSPKEEEVEGGSIEEVIRKYSDQYQEELWENVVRDGEIKEYVNVYLNGKDVRDKNGINTVVDVDDEIRIIPAASGGYK